MVEPLTQGPNLCGDILFLLLPSLIISRDLRLLDIGVKGEQDKVDKQGMTVTGGGV